jgi:hypothetical protein
MAGTQDGFCVAGAVLKFQPDQNRAFSFFKRCSYGSGVALRNGEDCRHRAAILQKITSWNAMLREGF